MRRLELRRIAVVAILMVGTGAPPSRAQPSTTPAALTLFDFSHPGATAGVEVKNGAAFVAEGASGPDAGKLVILADGKGGPVVTLPIPAASRDLSARRYIEFDVTNVSADKIVFTVWALSPGGWGGVSSYPASNTDGRETVEPAATKHVKIDLHARYPGPDVYTTATNPANITRLEFQFALAKTAKPGKQVAVSSIQASEVAPAGPENKVSGRVVVPTAEKGEPAPGKRVYQTLPGWENTSVTHVLGLPGDYVAGKKYPLIVEYTGNIFYHKFCYSTGFTDQGNMAWGLSKGEGFITLNLPFVSEDGKSEQVNAWGSPEKTAAYCVQAVNFACEKYGADPQAVFVTGFSRGLYACNYIALMNDEIADIWLGFIAAKPGEEWDIAKRGKGWNNVGIGWNERAARVKGRESIALPANLGSGVHVDVEFLEDRPSTVKTRQWMQRVLQDRPGTHAIRGRVVDASGKGVAGVRVASGPTHFTLTAADGTYELTSLVAGKRVVRASKEGCAFVAAEQSVALGDGDVEQVIFATR